MKSKKALSLIISTILLIAVASVIGFVTILWFQNFQGEFLTKQEFQQTSRPIEILGVQYVNEQRALVGLKNLGEGYHILDKIEINGQDCSVVGATNVVDSLSNVYVDCPVTLDENYEVGVFSNQGVSTKTFTSFEVGVDTQTNFEADNITVTFRNSQTCQLWETKLYGMDSINNSHAEIKDAGIDSYSVCVNHSTYIIGNVCTGDYDTIFYLANESNSHAYVDNSSARSVSNYYAWNQVCVSAQYSPNIVNVTYASTIPSSAFSCIGSIDGSDYHGRVVGDCDTAYNTKIWLRVS